MKPDEELPVSHFDRRTFLAGVGAAALPHWRFAPDPSPFQWSAIGKDAWVVQRGGSNTTVLREAGGAVVIDLKLGGVGYALEREIRARVGPIQAVIITHHHADHSEGLSAFQVDRSYIHRAAADRIRANLKATIAAAQSNPDRLVDQTFADLVRDFDYPRTAATEADIRRFVAWAAQAGPDARTPTDLLDDRSELRFGSTTLELIHHGPAHTDNDCFVFDRRRNLVIAGDLLFHRHHPFIDKDAGATTVGWQQAVDRILATATKRPTVVPGHGPVAGPEALVEQRSYFDLVRSMVAEQRQAGRTRKDITALPNTRFPGFAFADLWEANLGVLYDEAG